MTTDAPAANPPKKKTKWYWNALSYIALLWLFGGVNTLLLQDIPLLLFLLGVGFALVYPQEFLLSKEKPPLISGRRLLAGLGALAWTLFVLAVTFVLIMFVIPPFGISPQTTYLTEPRATKFYGIDYQSVIERELDPGVPPEDNGFRLLTETFGRPFFGAYSKDEHWHHLCRYLDLPTDIEPALTFTAWWKYESTLEPEEREIAKSFLVYWTQISQTLPEEAIPIVQRWLDENDAALDVFIIAAQKPVLYVPPVFNGVLIAALLPCEDVCREMVKSLQIRVRYRLAIGEIDKAWDDVLAMYRISELHRRGVWNIISSLVNTGMVGSTNQVAELVLLHSDWTAEEILRRAEEIMPFPQPWREEEIRLILRNDRFIALDALAHVANGADDFGVFSSSDSQCCPRPDADSWFGPINTMRFARLGIVMESVNQRFDEFEQWYFCDDQVLVYEIAKFDLYDFLKTVAWYGYCGVLPRSIGPTLIDLLCPGVETWRASHKRLEADVSLMRLLFALEAYHRDKGEYPEVLDDLLGHYIDEMPLDPFSGESFRYVWEESGYLLYSVGPNGIDEDGRGYNDMPKGDDIRRRVPIGMQ